MPRRRKSSSSHSQEIVSCPPSDNSPSQAANKGCTTALSTSPGLKSPSDLMPAQSPTLVDSDLSKSKHNEKNEGDLKGTCEGASADADTSNTSTVLNSSGDNPSPPSNLGEFSEKCCIPGGCQHKEDLIEDPEDGVRVLCSNETCSQGNWMHQDCFNKWEQYLLTQLRSSGRARSWTDKQRIQNLWTKKAYDLIFRSCECLCKRGFLTKDTEYETAIASRTNAIAGQQQRRRGKSGQLQTVHQQSQRRGDMRIDGVPNRNAVHFHSNGNTDTATSPGSYPSNFHHHYGPGGTVSGSGMGAMNGHYNNMHHRRIRSRQISSSSTASTGTFSSSPPQEEFSPPLSPEFSTLNEEHSSTNFAPHHPSAQRFIHGNRSRNSSTRKNSGSGNSGSLSAWESLNTRGNIFRQRQDFGCFQSLSHEKQNSYHIHMEDDSCNGNDDTKLFVLTNLTAHRAVQVSCLVCHGTLPVFDHFPLINGTFFLSPICHEEGIGLPVEGGAGDQRTKYLHAVCMRCLERPSISCNKCHKPWSGNQLIIGSMYSYDILAATPCCYQHLTCKSCGKVAISADAGKLNYFSEYSQAQECPHCSTLDFHFVKRFSEAFSSLPSLNPAQQQQVNMNALVATVTNSLATSQTGSNAPGGYPHHHNSSAQNTQMHPLTSRVA